MLMNRNWNLKINESIDQRRLSKNLLLVCLARLQERILYSKLTLNEAKKQRSIIAKAALDNGISKEEITDNIKRISPKDHPTDKKIEIISAICKSGNYTFDCDFIPDRMIHYKTDGEMLADAQREPVKRKVEQVDEDLQKLINYVQKEILYSELTASMIKELKSLKTGEYTYQVILKTFQDSKETIVKAKWHNHFDSTYQYYKYILKVVKNALPDGLQRIKKQERDREWQDKMAEKIMSEKPYVHIFKPPETKKLSPELEALL